VPSGTGVFLRLLVGELWTPKLAQLFAYGKCLYTYRIVLHGASDLDQRCLKTRSSKDGCTFGGLKNVPLYFSGFARDVWTQELVRYRGLAHCAFMFKFKYYYTLLKIFSKFFSPSGSHTILVFPYQTRWG